MPQEKIKVAVFVSGGVVVDIVTSAPSLVDAIVVDYDDAEADNQSQDEKDADSTFQDGSSVADNALSAIW